MAGRHKEQSAFEPHFLSTVESWFAESPDILAFIRLSASGGGGTYYWYNQFEAFEAFVRHLPPRADVIVFRGDRLPLRGLVNDEFIQRALQLFPDHTELMVVWPLVPPNGTPHRNLCDSHAELYESLADLRKWSIEAAAGFAAPWWEPDNDNMISALVPLADGTVERGIY